MSLHAGGGAMWARRKFEAKGVDHQDKDSVYFRWFRPTSKLTSLFTLGAVAYKEFLVQSPPEPLDKFAYLM